MIKNNLFNVFEKEVFSRSEIKFQNLFKIFINVFSFDSSFLDQSKSHSWLYIVYLEIYINLLLILSFKTWLLQSQFLKIDILYPHRYINKNRFQLSCQFTILLSHELCHYILHSKIVNNQQKSENSEILFFTQKQYSMRNQRKWLIYKSIVGPHSQLVLLLNIASKNILTLAASHFDNRFIESLRDKVLMSLFQDFIRNIVEKFYVEFASIEIFEKILVLIFVNLWIIVNWDHLVGLILILSKRSEGLSWFQFFQIEQNMIDSNIALIYIPCSLTGSVSNQFLFLESHKQRLWFLKSLFKINFENTFFDNLTLLLNHDRIVFLLNLDLLKTVDLKLFFLFRKNGKLATVP